MVESVKISIDSSIVDFLWAISYCHWGISITENTLPNYHLNLDLRFIALATTRPIIKTAVIAKLLGLQVDNFLRKILNSESAILSNNKIFIVSENSTDSDSYSYFYHPPGFIFRNFIKIYNQNILNIFIFSVFRNCWR